MSSLEIRPASEDAFRVAIDWAASEGWNPGLDDLSVFHGADPDGFLMGFIDGTPVSSISVVRYGTHYGFLGFYIVRPDVRGSGVGIATWHAGMAHLQGRTIGLDGVVDQQDNYKKSGFVFAGRNVRYSGVPDRAPTVSPITVHEATSEHLQALVDFDQTYFPASRSTFIKSWILSETPSGRTTRLTLKNDRVSGYGVIRPCISGYKIGPLFAETEAIAQALVAELCASTDKGSEVTIDIPEDNPAAVRLAQSLNLTPVFETARMYKGAPPVLPINNIFGITSFELG